MTVGGYTLNLPQPVIIEIKLTGIELPELTTIEEFLQFPKVVSAVSHIDLSVLDGVSDEDILALMSTLPGERLPDWFVDALDIEIEFGTDSITAIPIFEATLDAGSVAALETYLENLDENPLVADAVEFAMNAIAYAAGFRQEVVVYEFQEYLAQEIYDKLPSWAKAAFLLAPIYRPQQNETLSQWMVKLAGNQTLASVLSWIISNIAGAEEGGQTVQVALTIGDWRAMFRAAEENLLNDAVNEFLGVPIVQWSGIHKVVPPTRVYHGLILPNTDGTFRVEYLAYADGLTFTYDDLGELTIFPELLGMLEGWNMVDELEVLSAVKNFVPEWFTSWELPMLPVAALGRVNVTGLGFPRVVHYRSNDGREQLVVLPGLDFTSPAEHILLHAENDLDWFREGYRFTRWRRMIDEPILGDYYPGTLGYYYAGRQVDIYPTVVDGGIFNQNTFWAQWQRMGNVVLTINRVNSGEEVLTREVLYNFELSEGRAVFEVPLGYTWDGHWFIDQEGKENINGYRVKEAMTVYVNLEAIKYTVIFDPNGGQFVGESQEPTITVTVEYTIELPEVTREGWVFNGWAELVDGELVTEFALTGTTSDRTFVAQWLEKLTVTFDSGEGTPVESQIVVEGELAEEPPKPTRPGYTFDVWMLGDEEFDFDTPITESIILTARWIAIQVNFVIETDILADPADPESTIDVPFSREVNQVLDPNFSIEEEMDIELENAGWFDKVAYSDVSDTVQSTDSWVNSHTDAGWSDDAGNTLADLDTMVNGTQEPPEEQGFFRRLLSVFTGEENGQETPEVITFTNQLSIRMHTVQFYDPTVDLHGKMEQEVPHGAYLQDPPLEAPQYRLQENEAGGGWFLGVTDVVSRATTNAMTPGGNPASDLLVINTNTRPQAGGQIEGFAATALAIAPFFESGQRFVFSDYDPELIAELGGETPVTGDKLLTFNRVIEELPVLDYTVTFWADYVGGNLIAVENVRSGEVVREIVGEGILGWVTADGTPFDFSTPIRSDLHLIAVWREGAQPPPPAEEVAWHTVRFFVLDELVRAVAVRDGFTIAEEYIPADPVREGYTFTGWHVNPAFDFATPITQDTDLHANFLADGEVTGDPAEVPADGEQGQPGAPGQPGAAGQPVHQGRLAQTGDATTMMAVFIGLGLLIVAAGFAAYKVKRARE